MADAAVVNAHGNEIAGEFRHGLFRFIAHHPGDLLRPLCCAAAEPLVCEGHQLFRVAVEDHIHRCIPGGIVAIHPFLPVVPEAGNKRDSMNVTSQMCGRVAGDSLDEKSEVQDADGAVSCVKDAAKELSR